MSLAERLVVGLLVATSVVYAATPYAIALADRFGFYDRPVGYKGHARPTPYLGGAAVVSGFVLALLLAAGDWPRTVPLVGGVAFLWAVGTIDDRRTVRPAWRVLIELALAWMIWASGLGWSLHMGAAVDLGLTCLWILAVVNAFNLFDNMDGAAGTMALVVSGGAALIGVVRGDVWLAVGAASLGGACLGFLPRNLCLPARIFLGDGGSMPIGFAVAVLVMSAATTSVPGWQALPVALLLVGLPALDTALVIVSRRRRGAPVLAGGKDHLTHRTRRLLPSARAVAVGLGAVQAVFCVLALLASEGGSSFVVLAAAVYGIAVLFAVAVFESRIAYDATDSLLAAAPGSSTTYDERSTSSSGTLPGPARDLSPQAALLLALLGLGAGLSAFWFGYYGSGVWVPIGLGVVVLCAIACIARPMRPGAPAMLAVFGLLGFGVWSLCSTAWTESIEGAVTEGNRWLVYGALLLLFVVLVRSERRARLLLLAGAAGVVAVALSVLARLLGADPAALFLGGRLNSPLGYINGEGCLFGMGFWLCLGAAESRRALVAGPAAAMATLMACLALLTQSRGTALAMVAVLLVVMAFVPGRPRRAYVLLVVGGALAFAGPSLLHVYSSVSAGTISAEAAHAAGRAALGAAFGAGVVWALLTAVWRLLESRPDLLASARTAGALALAVPMLAGAALVLAAAHTIEREARTQWSAFVHLGSSEETSSPTSAPKIATSPAARRVVAVAPVQGSSRLLSGGGNRYDYWRIAWRLWSEHPIAGVGGNGYSRYYYERRATAEDINQPHSIELQALSELGAIGGLLLACFVGAACWGLARMRRSARSSAPTRMLAVAATGAFGVWLGQASVDWMHRLPGLTAIALAGVAALVWPRAARRGTRPHLSRLYAARLLDGPRAATLAAAVAIATLVVTGGSLSRQGLAQIYAKRALAEVIARPAAAAADAERSLDLDSDAVDTYYVKAAALARSDRPSVVGATLQAALRREPHDFVTWTLLGDVAVRERHFAAASRYYRRAQALNPLDPTLRPLAADPRSALR